MTFSFLYSHNATQQGLIGTVPLTTQAMSDCVDRNLPTTSALDIVKVYVTDVYTEHDIVIVP